MGYLLHTIEAHEPLTAGVAAQISHQVTANEKAAVLEGFGADRPSTWTYRQACAAERRADDRADRASAIYVRLRDEMRQALLNDPKRVVSAPGIPRTMTAADMVADSFAGKSGEQHLHDMLTILGDAAKGQDVRPRILLLFSVMAEKHAQFHTGDALEACE